MISDETLRQMRDDEGAGDCGQWGKDVARELLAAREALRFLDQSAVQYAEVFEEDLCCLCGGKDRHGEDCAVTRARACLPEHQGEGA